MAAERVPEPLNKRGGYMYVCGYTVCTLMSPMYVHKYHSEFRLYTLIIYFRLYVCAYTVSSDLMSPFIIAIVYVLV